ncbi:MAG: PhoH family protein [Brevinema sp.]
MNKKDKTSLNFILPIHIDLLNFCGVHDSNLRCLERDRDLNIYPKKDSTFLLEGSSKDVLHTKRVMEAMLRLSKNKLLITHEDILMISKKIEKDSTGIFSHNNGLMINKMKTIKAKTTQQDEYLQKIMSFDLVLGVGPAGTGKTYLAVAVALNLLYQGSINKIIFTRPVVEADESLGFLPGTLEEKLDPYVRPLFDAMNDMIPMKEFEKLLENGQIELAPLAYMRGRTLSNAVIVLDEAQNTTINQMKMFLTRLGENSKMIITGDITQIDLKKVESGLVDALNKLKKIKEIGIHYFDETQVIRHGLVRKIIEAYDNKKA